MMFKCLVDYNWQLSHTQLPADLSESVADDIEIMPQLIHGTGYAPGVSQDLNGLSIWIILHSKWTLNCFGEFSTKTKKRSPISEDGGLMKTKQTTEDLFHTLGKRQIFIRYVCNIFSYLQAQKAP